MLIFTADQQKGSIFSKSNEMILEWLTLLNFTETLGFNQFCGSDLNEAENLNQTKQQPIILLFYVDDHKKSEETQTHSNITIDTEIQVIKWFWECLRVWNCFQNKLKLLFP